MVDNGFYEFATNRYNDEGMKAAELLLATVIHHGRSHTTDDQTHLLDPLYAMSGSKR